MPLGTEVGLGPGDIVLDRYPAAPAERGTAAPHFSAHFDLAGSPISVELFCFPTDSVKALKGTQSIDPKTRKIPTAWPRAFFIHCAKFDLG